MEAAFSLGRCLLDLAPLFGQPEEPESRVLRGCLVPSAMTAGQGLETWPRELPLQPVPVYQTVKAMSWDISLSFLNRE